MLHLLLVGCLNSGSDVFSVCNVVFHSSIQLSCRKITWLASCRRLDGVKMYCSYDLWVTICQGVLAQVKVFKVTIVWTGSTRVLQGLYKTVQEFQCLQLLKHLLASAIYYWWCCEDPPIFLRSSSVDSHRCLHRRNVTHLLKTWEMTIARP